MLLISKIPAQFTANELFGKLQLTTTLVKRFLIVAAGLEVIQAKETTRSDLHRLMKEFFDRRVVLFQKIFPNAAVSPHLKYKSIKVREELTGGKLFLQ